MVVVVVSGTGSRGGGSGEVEVAVWECNGRVCNDDLNAKCPIFLGNFTPKTSNYCLKNRALGFPGNRHILGKSWATISRPHRLNSRFIHVIMGIEGRMPTPNANLLERMPS